MRLFLKIILCYCSLSLSGQTVPQIVDSLEFFLLQYDDIEDGPYEYDYTWLYPNDDENNSLAEAAESSYLEEELTALNNKRVQEKLEALLSHKEITKYSLIELLKHERLFVIASDDEKLFGVMLPENTGGSYKSWIANIHYRSNNGKVLNWFDEEDGPFHPDGYNSIYRLVNIAGDTTYLLKNMVAYCTTCYYEGLEYFMFEDNKPQLLFKHSIEGRDHEMDKLSFDPGSRLITSSFFKSDLMDTCNCKNAKLEENQVCKERFIFSGMNFENIDCQISSK